MKFILQITPTRSDFLGTMTEQEKATIGAHFLYLKARHEQGKLDFTGRRDDAAFGIAVFDADSEAEARQFVDNDPAVKGGIFRATLGGFSYAIGSAS